MDMELVSVEEEQREKEDKLWESLVLLHTRMDSMDANLAIISQRFEHLSDMEQSLGPTFSDSVIIVGEEEPIRDGEEGDGCCSCCFRVTPFYGGSPLTRLGGFGYR